MLGSYDSVESAEVLICLRKVVKAKYFGSGCINSSIYLASFVLRCFGFWIRAVSCKLTIDD